MNEQALDPVQVIVMLSAHTQTPLARCGVVQRAVAQLLEDGMIERTMGNGPVPFCNSAQANAICRKICRMTPPFRKVNHEKER